jgi:hypothetical protein
MLALLAQLHPGRYHSGYGFFSIDGPIGLFVALVVFLCIAFVLWRIAAIVMRKFGVDADIVQIVYLLFLVCVLAEFLHIVGLY